MSIEMAAGELNHHHSHEPAPASLSPPLHGSFLLSCPNFSSDIFYGADEENGCFYSLLPADASFGIMEKNFSKSHQEGMVPPSPKLEDFLGCGPKLGTHPYSNMDREALAQSNHILKQEDIRSHYYSSELLQQPLHEGICSNSEGNEMYQEPFAGEQMFDYGFHGLKNWVDKREVCFDPVGLLRHDDLNPLSLSMSPGSLSSCVTASRQKITSVSENEHMALARPKKRANRRGGEKQLQVHKKSIGQRTSQYKGVTRHRWTGRYEAHLWDNSCKKEGQKRKGRQVYLGGYDMEEKAARSYDLAALKYWGSSTRINFTLEDYQEELMQMKNMSTQEYVAHLRRNSSGFSRGASIYRGVTRHHRHGRWQARIGRVSGNKDLYLGTFGTQEEAAEAYDIAAIKFRSANAVTNFSLSRYDVKMIMGSSTLLPVELARRVEAIDQPFNNASSTSKQVDATDRNSNRSSSRNGSLNNAVLPMALAKPSSKFFCPATQLISWVSSNQLKNVIPMAQMPIYACME